MVAEPHECPAPSCRACYGSGAGRIAFGQLLPFYVDLFKIDRSKLTILIHAFWGILSSAMKKEPSQRQALAVRCPTCGAAPGQKCELSTGQPRTEPHRDRRLIGADLTWRHPDDKPAQPTTHPELSR